MDDMESLFLLPLILRFTQSQPIYLSQRPPLSKFKRSICLKPLASYLPFFLEMASSTHLTTLPKDNTHPYIDATQPYTAHRAPSYTTQNPQPTQSTSKDIHPTNVLNKKRKSDESCATNCCKSHGRNDCDCEPCLV